MKVTRPTNTLEVCKMQCFTDKLLVKQYKGANLQECLAQITDIIDCVYHIFDKKITPADLIDLINNSPDGDDYVYFIKDVTNRDYIYIDEQCSIDNARLCKDFEGR